MCLVCLCQYEICDSLAHQRNCFCCVLSAKAGKDVETKNYVSSPASAIRDNTGCLWVLSGQLVWDVFLSLSGSTMGAALAVTAACARWAPFQPP